MKIELHLFGAFREFDRSARINVEIADGARVSELRKAVLAYGERHWLGFRPGLLSRSAFASEAAILRDGELVPANGQMVLLPPVSGG